MDALSSQATVSGYKAVLLAADRLPRFFPMLMTAAGTVPPAKVLVLGAGVAGLQAIATARRLGAVVSGYDVRPVVREQVESLGASFLDLGVVGEETSGGYARELSDEELLRQQAELERRMADFDVVVTTALIPGRPAPMLIPASAVEAMRDGSVIVDLAAEAGGNCELTEPGEEVEREGVTIVGHTNLPSTVPVRCKPAVLAKRPGAAHTPRARGRAHARLGRRDHRRRLCDAARGGAGVSTQLVAELTIFALAVFLGFELIAKVPTMLHTPLMSGTNAIHGIVLIGAMLIVGTADSTLEQVFGFIAVVFGTINIVGGFLVTDRMLEMFKRRPGEDTEKRE